MSGAGFSAAAQAGGGRHGAAAVLLVLLALAGAALVLHASYPGYLNEDTVHQLRGILAGRLDDWQPPFVALVWSGLLQLFPGPVGFIVLDNLLIWGALLAIGLVLARSVGAWALPVMAVPLMPGLSNFLGHVHKDAMLAAWLLAAFACALRAQRGEAGARGWQLAANLLAVAAFLTRSNVIFALVPLLLYANLRLGWRRNLAASLLVLALMPLLQGAQNRLLDVHPLHPGDSIKTYHLLGLSYVQGRNLLPGQWTEAQSGRIVQECYTPVQWDLAAYWGQCGFVHDELKRQQVWGSGQMTRAWLAGLAADPLAGYSVMAATFRRSMDDPNSRNMLYTPPMSPPVVWAVTPPLRETTVLAQAYARSGFNDKYGRPRVFVALYLLSGLLLFGLRLATTRLGLFALALTASGVVYLLTYFPLNVSAEYRYFYWSGFAAWLGLAVAALAWLARRRGAAGAEAAALPATVRLAASAAIAAAFCLTFLPAKLPLEGRRIFITPLEPGEVVLTGLSTASIPVWMGVRFEGRMEAPPQWHGNGLEWRTGAAGATLSAAVKNLHQTIQLRFATGPHGARVEIADDTGVRRIDTRSETPGERIVDLEPPLRAVERARHVPWRDIFRTWIGCLVLAMVLFRLSR